MTTPLQQAVSPGTAGVRQLLTDPKLLMRPERLQSLPPSRVSVGRSMLEKMVVEGWKIERVHFDVDAHSRGEALYRVSAGAHTLDFIVFGFEPSREGRSGRITEKNWDMMAALVDRGTEQVDHDITREELPKLYSGRAVAGTLTWARSNRSFRAFDHVVQALSEGRQPDTRFLWEIGYLMRNTGLDGNGTFNTRSFLALGEDHPLHAPLHAQLLSAFLMREYAADLVNQLAAHAGGERAVELAPELRRMIGIGNGSALGLLFFVNTHPHLINAWLGNRQQGIVEGSQLRLEAGEEPSELLLDLLGRASAFYAGDPYIYHRFEDPETVGADLATAREALVDLLAQGPTTGEDLLARLHGRVCQEAWEVVAANLLELLPAERIGELVQGGTVAETMRTAPLSTVAELRQLVEAEYAWAFEIDMDAPGARHFVWYKSFDAEEPRRGPASEVTDGRNWALDLPGSLQELHAMLTQSEPSLRVGELLALHPELRSTVERVQSLAGKPFHSPHMNMLDEEFVPVSIVRFMNASVHGLYRTVDEADDRNVLGLIYLGAPTAAEITAGTAGDARYPSMPTAPAAQQA